MSVLGVRARASVRHLLQHPWQFGLATLGITFGVALAVGMDVAGASVRQAFALATEAASGRTTHEIVGGPQGVPESLYRQLRVELGLHQIAPFVGGALAVADRPGEVVQLLGVDPFAEAPLRPALAWNGPAAQPALVALLTRPGAAVVSAGTARRLGLQPQSTLVLRVGAVRRSLTVAAVWQEPGEAERRALDGVVVVDVATAQELLGQAGWLTRIDVRAAGAPGAGPPGETLATIAAALPPGVRLESVAARTGALLAMTRAFDLNLRSLSLLALMVGAFLIYNTQTFSVVQRRPLLGILRTLGATRGQVVNLVLAEALVLGALGTVLGLLLGVGMGRGLVRLVSRAVSDLYFVVTVRGVALPAGVLLRGAALGVGAAVLSSLPAAREAARAEPRLALLRSALEQGIRGRLPVVADLAVVLAVAALLLLQLSGQSLPVALVALLLVLLAAALAAPVVTALLAGLAGRVLGGAFGLPGQMAGRGVGRSLSRTGVAIAALMVALSVTVGVSIMVQSFRTAVEEWLAHTLRADVYVSAAPLVAARNEARLPRELVDRLRALPGVASVGTARGVTVPGAGGPERVGLTVLETDWRRGGPRLLAGHPQQAFPAFQQGEAVLVTEPFAYKRGVRVGGSVALLTRAGPRSFPVAGVVRDYSSEAGLVLMSRRTYDRYFDDPFVSSVALYAAPGQSVDALVERARAAARPGEELFVRSNRALRQSTLAVFDHTFEVTAVLRWLALVVAAFGVTSALLALELERTRELGVLRALGFTAGQVAGLVAAETALLGLVAGLLAIPVGGALAAMLVFVINRRSFGWTMELVLSPGALALAPLLGLVAGLLGGLYPAVLMARASPAEALRDE
jgi:putative ABC transport system permease protein